MSHTSRLYVFLFASLAIAAVGAVGVLAGCNKLSEPVIDASSQQSLSQSVEKIRTGITERTELDRLDNALADVARFSIDPKQVMSQAAQGRMPTKEEAFKNVSPLVDNLNKDQLYALASQLRQGYTNQLASYEKDLAQLRDRQTRVKKAAELMSNFVVVAADYANDSGTLAEAAGTSALKLSLTVQNNLTVPVGRAVMMVNLGPEGNLTPWISQRVEKVFDKPLQPGEQAKIEVYSYFGGLAPGAESIKPVLDAAMVELSGVDGAVIQSVPKWDQGDITQLNVLEIASDHIREQLATKAASAPGA